ncbi:MAG: hypothetical protein AB3N34_01220 [Lettuce witches'-broom phytoplasma]
MSIFLSIVVFFYFLLPLVFSLGVLEKLERNKVTVESVFKLQAPPEPDLDYTKLYETLWDKIIEEKYKEIMKKEKKTITVDKSVLFKKGIRYTDKEAREIMSQYPSIIKHAQEEGEKVINYLYALNDDKNLEPQYEFYFNDRQKPVKLYSVLKPEGRTFDIIYQKEDQKTQDTPYQFRAELDNFVNFTKPKKDNQGIPKDITEYVEFKRDVILDPYLLLFADNQYLFESYKNIKAELENQKKNVNKLKKNTMLLMLLIVHHIKMMTNVAPFLLNAIHLDWQKC